MASSIPAGHLRRTWGRDLWFPPEPFGGDGWRMYSKNGRSSVIVTVAVWEDGEQWVHASIAHEDRLPSYADLVVLHRSVWGETGYAFQVFAPPSDHVNIHANALHLWGRLDGERTHPDFAKHGTI
ncbi:hypothetical protein QDA03_gp58 [Microbacterium phage Terij]|uniref:DUF7694 domain-containing protein n=1 Tax=Microbacterium phage Terij TaxID=2686229 RepID=A0A6B9L934_9CAUD|nr:hypothetical protein QDA03_gp58 [Microbacterium phage Terij]QHB37183.1 hypothetical protein SEA_TERIJ_49 [Microbacterium phage Terij]